MRTASTGILPENEVRDPAPDLGGQGRAEFRRVGRVVRVRGPQSRARR